MEKKNLGSIHRRSRRRLAYVLAPCLVAMMAGVAVNGASASPVLIEESVTVGPFEPAGSEAAFGEHLDPMAGGVLVHGRDGFDTTMATYMVRTRGFLAGSELAEAGMVSSNGAIAGGEHTVAVVRYLDAGAILEVYRIGSGQLELVQEISVDEAGKGFGSSMAVNDRLLAVGSDDGTVDIYVPGVDGYFWRSQSIETGLGHLYLDVTDDTATVAVSGSEEFAAQGSLLIYRRVPDTDRFDPYGTFEHIGGGPVLIEGDDVFVQRNGYFARPVDYFSVVSRGESGYRRSASIPAEGSALAVNSTTVAIGNPVSNTVIVFGRPTDESHFYRFLQALTSPDDAGARFGSSLVASEGGLVVGSPGSEVDGVTNEGSLLQFRVGDGPVGCTIVGTEGDDTIQGTKNRDIICGLGGDDIIDGLGGNDVIYGGPGNDMIGGNAGRDYLVGGDGDDEIRGGDGSDTIFGGAGADQVFGGEGDDTIRGGDGRDILKGGDDDDSIWGDGGNDELFGEEDDDFLDGGDWDDVLHGGDDDDVLIGGANNDKLFGGSGDDSLFGGTGWDIARGQEGDGDACDRSNEVCTGVASTTPTVPKKKVPPPPPAQPQPEKQRPVGAP